MSPSLADCLRWEKHFSHSRNSLPKKTLCTSLSKTLLIYIGKISSHPEKYYTNYYYCSPWGWEHWTFNYSPSYFSISLTEYVEESLTILKNWMHFVTFFKVTSLGVKFMKHIVCENKDSQVWNHTSATRPKSSMERQW